MQIIKPPEQQAMEVVAFGFSKADGEFGGKLHISSG